MSTRNTSISGQHNTIAHRTTRTIRQCPVCHRDIALYADGTFYRHGPRGAECLGSHQEAHDEIPTPIGPVCGACGDDRDMCASPNAHHTVTEFDDMPTGDLVNRSACCNETMSRANPGHGPWSCDNCHRPADVSPTGPRVAAMRFELSGDGETAAMTGDTLTNHGNYHLWTCEPLTNDVYSKLANMAVGAVLHYANGTTITRMDDGMSPTGRALVQASAARDAAMQAAYEAEGTDREAEMDAAYETAYAAYRAANEAHRAARIANGDRSVSRA